VAPGFVPVTSLLTTAVREALIKSSTGTALASNGMQMEIAMRQIAFACQPSFEKFARASRRVPFLTTMDAVVPWAE